MFLRFNRRFKDGKEHRYWNIVENRRCVTGKVVQRQVLYLGEINDSQHEAWCRVIEAFDEDAGRHRQLALFPADRAVPDHAQGHGVQVRLDRMQLHRPRQWGACWLACQLYELLELDRFWARRLPDSREGTRWRHILQTLVCYRLIDPGSEWRLHRLWFEQSAMADLLGADDALVEKNALYRCLDRLLAHKPALFAHLRSRWQDLFAADFEVLLYDLTSTYFESAPPQDESDKRRYGYSRDKRNDCVQVVIALIVTPEGFPLAYEVLPTRSAGRLAITFESFGFKYGPARDPDLLIDVRFLPNPHYEPDLRPLTGEDPRVVAFIDRDGALQAFYERLHPLLDYLLPQYLAEGKAHLVVAIGCTGGRHRSVAIARHLAERYGTQGEYLVEVVDRDANRPA